MLMLVANVARPGAAPGEELAVMRAIAGIVNRDASRPFERLYFESEFEGAPFCRHFLENPDPINFADFRAQALTMVTELTIVTDRRNSTRKLRSRRA